MTELNFSAMDYGPHTRGVLEPLIREFELQTHIRVHLTILPWENGRLELNQIAFYQKGPDVSEIGQTWLSDMIAMNALRPFSRFDLAKIGKFEDFLPVSWVNCSLLDDPKVWAVPWLTDIFTIHYRKDLLREVGVDDTAAFESFEAIDRTVETLKQKGASLPIALPLHHDAYTNLHCAAPWVWGFGGDFCARDGRNVLFDQPPALQGLAAYYRLLRHLSQEELTICHDQPFIELFQMGKAAIIFAPQGIQTEGTDIIPEVLQNWGVASFPAGSLTGGSNLVIWNHTRLEREAVEFVRFLTSPEFQSKFALPLGVLPCRIESFSLPGYRDNPRVQALMPILQKARTYQTIPLWGMIEERLAKALQDIWEEYYQNPGGDIETIISRHIHRLATRLNLTLAQYRRS